MPQYKGWGRSNTMAPDPDKPTFWIYYRRSPTFHVDKKLTREQVLKEQTHVLITLIDRVSRDSAYYSMQAPNMSEGSRLRVQAARERWGISLHTSMSVGDCICTNTASGKGTMYQCTNDGWKKVN